MKKECSLQTEGYMGEHVKQCDVASLVGATLFRFKTRGFDRILCMSVCASLSRSLSLSFSLSLFLSFSLSQKKHFSSLIESLTLPSFMPPCLPTSLSPQSSYYSFLALAQYGWHINTRNTRLQRFERGQHCPCQLRKGKQKKLHGSLTSD